MPIFFIFCFAHNFLNIDPILTKAVRIESPERELSIGTGFVKIGPILIQLWMRYYHDPICVLLLGVF